MAFELPWALALAVPWLVFCGRFARLQRRALDWALAHVSDRFRPAVTLYSTGSLRSHLVFLALIGMLLIVAGARPTLPGRAELVSGGGRVLLLLDGSTSMYADDAEALDPDDEPSKNRFQLAQEIAGEAVHGLAGFRFALASFSGVATLHLPMTGEPELVLEALRTIEVHNQYRSSGSSFAQALDVVFHFAAHGAKDLQVVILSDGEPPFSEDYDAQLAALADQEIPVHTIALGSLKGQARRVFDFRDVVAKKKDRRVLREYTTRRVDEHLERISEATGGRFGVASREAASELLATIREHPIEGAQVEKEAARTDLSALVVAIFLAGFLLEALVFARRGRRPSFGFELERLGGRPPGSSGTAEARRFDRRAAGVALVGLALGCGGPLWWRAHRENELGIARDLMARHVAARTHYERSLGYRFKPEVPTYNLARSATLRGDFSEAHTFFQEALKLEPGQAEAHMGDAVALYRWGAAERDPRDCELERTLDLWRQSLRRFATTVELTEPESPLGAGARADHRFLKVSIKEVEKLVEDPPEHCTPPPPEGGGSGGGGGGDSPQEPPPSSASSAPEEDAQAEEPPPREPPPGAPPPEPPPTGASEPPPDDRSSGGATPPPPRMSGAELDQVRQALERIRQQSQEQGKYHRRTLPEQFAKESWENPDPEIWW